MDILRKHGEATMHVVGIDAGSRAIKAVFLDTSGKVFFRISKTGANSVNSARQTLEDLMQDAGLAGLWPNYIVSTGYGRNYIDFSKKSVTEISCHARGVRHFLPEARTIIDIGGQDSKVIYLDEDGNLVDFLMNDKCAAGTGRFLEVIAEALGISLEQMSEETGKSKAEVTISSTCTVFAESEVISHVARGRALEDIVAGICRSIVRRILGMAQRRAIVSPLVVTGGVAKNNGVIQMIQDELGYRVLVPDEPQITGAMGAALIALNEVADHEVV
jgi:predicted CoA-substrate-specific enzyme activase